MDYSLEHYYDFDYKSMLNEVYSYICICKAPPTTNDYYYYLLVVAVIPSVVFGIGGVAYGIMKRNELIKYEQCRLKKLKELKLTRDLLATITIPTDLKSLTDSENYSEPVSSTDYQMEEIPLN